MKIKKELRSSLLWIILLIIFLILLILVIILTGFNLPGINLAPPTKSGTSFNIMPLTSQDIAYDRFMVNNTGKENLTTYAVQIDSNPIGIVADKKIIPGNAKYLYLSEYYPSGRHTLTVVSNGFSKSLKINIPTDLHAGRINNSIS
ncbi:hypothetical protein HYW74_05190 [Candidatus Pacearchaeota archaeon]|nr:hypothetical protein [Candidatus Pacearchaeota archaeon]